MAVRRNVIANLGGSAWAGLVAFAFIPIYLRTIGPAGYGLVGFFVTLASLMSVFDGGFGAATARELATVSDNGKAGSVRNLVHTLEVIFWGIALVLGASVFFSAPFLADHWLNLGTLERNDALDALKLMGLTLALQWPVAYYSGCIVGLQRQVGLNFINTIALTLRFGGAAVVVSYWSPTVSAFFVWQAFSMLLHVMTLQIYLWRAMPGTESPTFSMPELKGVGRFAAGVGGINVLALIISQADKIVLSKIIPLEQLGYYTMAAALASVVGRVMLPIFNATYPRLITLVASKDEKETDLILFYRKACQLIAFAIVPLALVLVVFGREIMLLWTGDANLAQSLRWVIACLAAGTMLNGFMIIPYALQLAERWTSLGFWQNVIAVTVMIPAIAAAAFYFGLVGAASIWLVLNAGYVAIAAPIMYRRLLKKEKRNWYLNSVALPIITTLAVLLPIKFISESYTDLSRIKLFLIVACAGLIAQGVLGLMLYARRSKLNFG